jgi:hypothetical protein
VTGGVLAYHLDFKWCTVLLKQCSKWYHSGVGLLPSSSTSTAAAWSINLDRARFDREGCSSRDSSSSKSSRSAGQPLMIHSCRVATRVLAAMQCLLHLSTASYSHRNHSSERMSCSTGTINAASPAPTKAFVGISSSPGPSRNISSTAALDPSAPL